MTNENEKKTDLIVFLDTIGRTIIGKKTKENDTEITVVNPAVVNIVPQQSVDPNTGQQIQRMALQLFPLFFREFLAEKDNEVGFLFKKNNITLSDGNIVLDFKVTIQYEQLFAVVGTINNTTPTPQPAPAGDNIIQLFDEE